jgi:signal transduction histidine kinase
MSLALLRLEMVKAENTEDVGAVRGALRSGRAMCNAFLGSDETNADYQLAPLIEQEVRGAVDSSVLRKVKVAIRCGATVLVHAPESALRRFLHNAVMNAIEASPDGSQILVEVISAGPGRVEICVEDQGVGLSAVGVANSFAPGSSGRGSSGIGTASLRDAADALGFPLVVSTSQGAGTRVSVQACTARADRPVAVLLDADPTLALSIRAALEASGWWVIQESTEDAAISALDRLGASLCVVRRGAPGGGVAALRTAAKDLEVPFFEISAEEASCPIAAP